MLVELGMHITTRKGYAFKSKWFSDDGCPIVKVTNFTTDSIDTLNLVKIPERIANDYMKYQLKTNDVIIQTVGSWPSNPASVVGKVIRVPKNANGVLLNQNAVMIEPDVTIHKGYLYYLLRNDTFKNYIVGTAQGSASQASITLASIKAYKFEAPALEIQRKIANILSNYDRLIENNNQRIATLDEMVQVIYREWFVNFNFPTLKNIKFMDSSLGDIPEEWKVVPLFEIADVKYGKNLPTKQLIDLAPFPVYGASKIIGRFTEFNRKNRTLICGCRGSVGKMHITLPQSFVTNNSFTFDLDEYSFYWLYLNLMHRGFQDVIGGSAQPQITLTGISKVQLLKPTDLTLKAFHEIIHPLFHLKFCLEEKNCNLQKSRDLLLQQLFSGKIDVSDLDMEVNE